MIHHDLATYLASRSAVSDIVGTRIYAVRAPQTSGSKVQARIVYRLLPGSVRHYHSRGASGLVEANIELLFGAEKEPDSYAIYEAVRNEIDGFSGEWDGTVIDNCTLSTPSTASGDPTQGDDTGFPAVRAVASVFYQESLPTISEGPLFPSGFPNPTWADAENIGATDGAGATTSTTTTTSELLAGSFGFDIPVNAVIRGVKLDIIRKSAGTVEDHSIRLRVGGVVSGDNKAVAGAWGAAYETATYGGQTDLWGLDLTPADVNVSDFGVAIQAKKVSGFIATADVDSVSLTIYHSPAGS